MFLFVWYGCLIVKVVGQGEGKLLDITQLKKEAQTLLDFSHRQPAASYWSRREMNYPLNTLSVVICPVLCAHFYQISSNMGK